jgi:hypothetical protein
MLKRVLQRLPQNVYYNLLTTHDMLQAMAWRLLAPAIAEDAFQAKYRMLFVVGCGRSGTTIFSHCLGQHRNVAELNEPLHIWFGTSTETDIISPFAGLVGGRCRLDRHDVSDKIKTRYRAMIDYHVKGRASIVCDKLPLNTFRVDYIAELCPAAKFILLHRLPRAVARSIEQCMKRDGNWWGPNDCKWQAISRYAEEHSDLCHIVPSAIDDYYRGLVEWRVGQKLALDDFAKLDPARCMHVHYEDFIADPRRITKDCFEFAGAEPDETAADFAADHVRPTKAETADERRSPEDDRLHAIILGDDLAQKTRAVA